MNLTPEQITKAKEWLGNHVKHVSHLIESEDITTYPPSDEDARHPELWKSAHWSWFLIKYV
jgi:hypothetical protein